MDRAKVKEFFLRLKPGPKVARALKITSVVVAVVAAVLAITPIIFRNKIANSVRAELNSMCNASVEFSDIEVSFFRHFPRVTVDVHNLRLNGAEKYADKELASIKRFEMTADMSSIFSDRVTIKEMWLHEPRLNVEMVDKNGVTVWDNVEFRGDGIVRSSFTFDAVHLCDGYLSFIDHREGSLVSDVLVGPFDVTLSGSLNNEDSFLNVDMQIERVEVVSDGEKYATRSPIRINGGVGYTNCEMRYAINDCTLSLGSFETGVSGTVQVGATPSTDLNIEFCGEGFEHASVKVLTHGELLEDMRFDISLDKAQVADVSMSDVRGKIVVRNGDISIDKLSAHLFGGHADLSGKLRMSATGGPTIDMQGSLEGGDMRRTFEQTGVLASMPMLENITGGYTLSFDGVCRLDENYHPLFESISGSGELRSRDLRIDNIPAPDVLSKVLGNKVPKTIQLSDEAVMPFSMDGGRFKVYTTNLEFGDITLRLSGETGLDASLDFDIAVILSSLTLNGEVGGTFDNPTYSFDTSEFIKDVFSPRSIIDKVSSWF